MKKPTLFYFFLLTLLFIANASRATCGQESCADPETVWQEMMTSQNVKSKEEIKCEKVSQEQFEELGEIAMSLMHPDPKEHEWRDQMMGDEGSASLKAAHAMMGQLYLGCPSATGSWSGGMMPMMSGWSQQTMGGYWLGNNFGWFGWLTGFLLVVVLILIILVLIKWLRK